MKTFIGFLRGVNVGGKNKIKMADLKKSLEALGLAEVETYLQSGNVIFASSGEEQALRREIEEKIRTDFGIVTSVVLRSAEELSEIIKGCPFSDAEIAASEDLNSEGESLYVQLFSDAPGVAAIETLSSFRSAEDDFRVVGRELYLLLCHSIRHSKVAAKLQKLKDPGTSRNWKTLQKLAVLLERRT